MTTGVDPLAAVLLISMVIGFLFIIVEDFSWRNFWFYHFIKMKTYISLYLVNNATYSVPEDKIFIYIF